MFSSPAIRPFSQENSGQIMAKKPAGNTLSARKPFADRSVNSKTPDITITKPKLQLTNKKPEKTFAFELEDDDLMFYDVCSYKDVRDDFKDICPKSERLTNRKILDILGAYCEYRSPRTPSPPPLEPETDDELLEIPHFHHDLAYNDQTDTAVVSVPEGFEESYEDISLPELDFDDFDM